MLMATGTHQVTIIYRGLIAAAVVGIGPDDEAIAKVLYRYLCFWFLS